MRKLLVPLLLFIVPGLIVGAALFCAVSLFMERYKK